MFDNVIPMDCIHLLDGVVEDLPVKVVHYAKNESFLLTLTNDCTLNTVLGAMAKF